MYSAQVQTMFKLIAIDLILLLINFSCELVQICFSDIALLGSDFKQCSKLFQLYLILALVKILCELRQQMIIS